MGRARRGERCDMTDSGHSGPQEQVLQFVARHLRTPAELDLLVHAHRSGRPSTTDQLAASTGLRRTHAQLCIDALIAGGMFTSSDGTYRVADDVTADAGAVAMVFDRFRLRLVESIMDAWSDG
jgi:hypothetical protein